MKLLSLRLIHLRFATCTSNLRRGAPIVLLTFLLLYTGLMTRADDLGLFEGHGDVGQCGKAGSVVFEPASGSYLVAGGGANMWFTNDACHFVWKRVSGNFSLQADAGFVGTGGNAHRKACLVIRQSLAPDAPYGGRPPAA
jgi:TolB protein